MLEIKVRLTQAKLPFWAAFFVVSICIAILGLSVLHEVQSRSNRIDIAEIELANLASSLVQHAEDSLSLLEASLVGLVSRLEAEGSGPEVIAKLSENLRKRVERSERIDRVFIFDERGAVLATSDPSGLSGSERAYFRQDSAAHGLMIGTPVRDVVTGDWILTASLRFNHLDGTFGGAVLATIKSSYFARFYRRFDLGVNGAITLMSADGVIIARQPDDGGSVGRNLSGSPLFQPPLVHSSSGTYHFTSPVDGLHRLSFFQRSNRLPLLLLATREQEEVLAQWRSMAFNRSVTVLALISLIAVVGFFLVRQLQSRHKITSALAAREADFRLLAEGSSDMVTRIGLDEKIRYVSPSCVSIVGWRPDQLKDTPALAGVHPDDLQRVKDVVAGLKRGDAMEARITYRTRHREMGEISLESTMRVTRRPEDGATNGVVAISRDVTRQKRAEGQLAILAVTDGLTGLANRRRFDERMHEEWARATREETPLSLLMIDVDHFKRFNDEYGHAGGDACLQSISAVLAAQARRSTDLAARYGGEEFVLLLPNTDAEGCRDIGNRICDELWRLNLRHAQNPPFLRVTVSIGGATAWLNPASVTNCSVLANEADEALYAAKQAGRNQVIMASQAPAEAFL